MSTLERGAAHAIGVAAKSSYCNFWLALFAAQARFAYIPFSLYIIGMPKRKNTKPTSIYWLVDVRPETLADGWSNGKPFYCGKTVTTPQNRFYAHKCEARTSPARPVSVAIIECNEHIRVVTMTVVPANGNWIAAERRWIRQIRLTNPDAVNVSPGGQGVSGVVASAATRAKMSESQRRHWRENPDNLKTLARLTAQKNPHKLEKMWVTSRGRKLSAETKRKIAESKANWPVEMRQKLGDLCRAKAKPHTEKTKQMLREKALGRKASAEARAKMSAAHLRRWAERKAASI